MPATQPESLPERPTTDAPLDSFLAREHHQRSIFGAILPGLRVNYPCDFEIAVADHGGTDSTAPWPDKILGDRLIVARHLASGGSDAVLPSSALIAARTHMLSFDADLEYDAADVPRILEPVLRNWCAVAY